MYLGVLLGYFSLILLVSFVFSKRVRNIEDFFLASRNLPAFLVYLTLAASWIGATSTLVSVDEAYKSGVSSFWIMGAPAVLTVLIFAFILARPIRQLKIVSLPDLVEKRYGLLVRHLASVLIVWYMILLAASQMVAAGNFLKMFLGTSYFSALVMGTIVVLIYSIIGGFFSVVITDSVQFALIVVGLVGLFIFLVNNVSLYEVSMAAVRLQKDNFFNPFADFDRNLLIVLSFTCAWIISPIAWQRIQAARSSKQARLGLGAAAMTFLVVYGFIVLIGLYALPVFPSGTQTGPLLSSLISSKTGPILGALLFIAIAAAIMSTLDTAINTGALSLTRDIFQRLFFWRDDKRVVLVSRISTLAVAGFAFLVATRLQSILKTLGLASEIMAEGLFVPGVAMLFLRKKRPAAGFLSLLLGSLYSIFGFLDGLNLIDVGWPEWPYSVPYGILISFLGFMFGLAVDNHRQKAAQP